MKPFDQLKLLQALSGLSRAMDKIKDCVEPGQIPDGHPRKELYAKLAKVCLQCADMAYQVANEFLKEKEAR